MISLFKKWLAELKDGPVDWEQLEAHLIQSDLGVKFSHRVLEKLKKKPLSATTVQQATVEELLSLWQMPLRELKLSSGMNVWLIVGVNGTGKTTTIAKLAHAFQKEEKKVFFVAADTFRAAAMEQLNIWAERLKIEIYCGKENGDPAAAAYEGIEAAKKANADLVLVDTAGRLHSKENLMRELAKTKRVIAKHGEKFPQETLLIIDGMSGVNAVNQAKEFQEALGVSGLIVTKMDSSSKGGVIAAIKAELNLETLWVGEGEQLDDLKIFEHREYVKNFFDET
ncbi:MAG: signal recognition particle-docking protein FtsY [Verrucomicrobiota bacterium]